MLNPRGTWRSLEFMHPTPSPSLILISPSECFVCDLWDDWGMFVVCWVSILDLLHRHQFMLLFFLVFFFGGGGGGAFFFLSETIVFKWDIKKTRKASLLTEIICIIFCVFLCRCWSVKDTDAWLFVSAIQQAIPAQGAWWSCSVLSPLESGKKFVFHWAAICLYACLSVCLSVFWIDILSLLSLMNMYLHTVIYTQCTT